MSTTTLARADDGRNPVRVIDFGRVIWPPYLRLPVRRFRLCVAGDTTQASTLEIGEFAQAALGRGMVYLCVWGRGCERFHDIVDAILAEDAKGERKYVGPEPEDVILTTWHDRDRLEEAVDFFANCAIPTDGYLDGSDYWLMACVGSSELASRAARLVRTIPICKGAPDSRSKTPPWLEQDAAPFGATPDSPAARVPPEPPGKRVTASLLFDSSRKLAPAGIRGAAAVERQLLFQAGDILVDMVIAKPRQERICLVGQVMRKNVAFVNAPVELRQGTTRCATLTNRFGEFEFETSDTTQLSLAVTLSALRVIEIPLKVLGDC